MRKSHIVYILVGLFISACIIACGPETETGSSSTTGGLAMYTDDVKACMPYLGSSTLDQWADWSPTASGSILGKLFNPEIGGDECIYTRIELLDSHIEMINEFSDDWDTDGEYTRDNMTATVDNKTKIVMIPYMNVGGLFPGILGSISVDRVITLEGSDDLTIHMGFKKETSKESFLEHYEIGGSEAGVYYVLRDDTTGIIQIWHASITSKKVQIMWEGNTNDNSFKIIECTNTTGNWEVMGGGSIANSSSEMAFMARNDDNNLSNDEYYITLTLDELNNATEMEIINNANTPPVDTGVLSYIVEGSSNCYGFLGGYPSSVDDLKWEN